jgi:hypothetical protein
MAGRGRLPAVRVRIVKSESAQGPVAGRDAENRRCIGVQAVISRLRLSEHCASTVLAALS